MAKFKAGDMITGTLVMSDGTEELRVYMVNRVFTETDNHRSFWFGKEIYSLDNGDGFIDARSLASQIDADFQLCN